MATFNCCGNQPTPIIIGLLVTYLTGLIDCYPLLSSSSSSVSSSPSPSDNINLGQIIYRPNFNSHSSAVSPVSSSPSSLSSQSPSAISSSSSPSVPISIVSPSSSSSSSQSSPVASQSSQQLPQSSSSSYHHSSSSSIPGIAFIQGPISDDDGAIINRRPTYQDYFDTFRLPLMSTTELERANDNGLITSNGLPPIGKQIKSPKFILSQPSTSPIDFDYVPFIQSDFNQPPPSSSYGSERSGSSDLYEDDYSDPVYDLKYDPIDDSNWLNEPTSSSYHHQQQQQPLPGLPGLPPISFISPSSSPYSSYSPYSLPLSPSSSGNTISSSEEMLTNLMVDYIIKELEKNAQQQSLSQSSEPVQHLIRLQKHHHHHPQQQQQQQPIDELKTYEGYMEKKSSSSSSLYRDKGSSLSSTSSGDKNKNNTNNKKETDSVKRIEQRGQKEFPMLRPATENNGKDDIDNQPSLASQLKSLSSSSSSSSTNHQAERNDDEVNQLKSLLQSD